MVVVEEVDGLEFEQCERDPLMNTNVDNQEAAIKCLDLPSNLLELHLK